MKTRTFLILVAVLVLVVAGTLVLRGEGGKSIADLFMRLHGR